MANGQLQAVPCKVTEALAWDHYWTHGNAARCVPHSALASAQLSACWRDFASFIPRAARVLDLGTGLGYVLKEIAGWRSDLTLIGIDCAAVPHQTAGLQIEAGIMMEQLPFQDDYFGAVCSQFGFEYSDIALSAHEVARVLRPGGTVQLVMHDAASVVVRQSCRRKAALEWVMEQSGIFETAARLIDVCRGLSNEALSAFKTSAVLATEQRLDPVAAEVASAMRHTIFASERAYTQVVKSTLATLITQGRNELAIVSALERAALDRDGIENVRSALTRAGLLPRSPRLIEARVGLPFAWLLRASKPES